MTKLIVLLSDPKVAGDIKTAELDLNQLVKDLVDGEFTGLIGRPLAESIASGLMRAGETWLNAKRAQLAQTQQAP